MLAGCGQQLVQRTCQACAKQQGKKARCSLLGTWAVNSKGVSVARFDGNSISLGLNHLNLYCGLEFNFNAAWAPPV